MPLSSTKVETSGTPSIFGFWENAPICTLYILPAEVAGKALVGILLNVVGCDGSFFSCAGGGVVFALAAAPLPAGGGVVFTGSVFTGSVFAGVVLTTGLVDGISFFTGEPAVPIVIEAAGKSKV